MPVFENISGKTNRQFMTRLLFTWSEEAESQDQLSMTIRSQRCEQKKNHLCLGYSWCVCVCVHVCLVGFFCTIQKCWYPCISSSHQTGFLSTSMYALNDMVGPRKSEVSQGDSLFEERIDEQNHDEDTHVAICCSHDVLLHIRCLTVKCVT